MRAGQTHFLPLAAGQFDGAAEHAGQQTVQAVGEFGDDRGRRRRSRPRAQVLGRGGVSGAADPDVHRGGHGPALKVLGEQGDSLEDLGAVQVGDVRLAPAQSAALGSSRPDRIFISVLLPEPFSPTTAVTEPIGSVSDTPSRAAMSRSG